jgi:glutaredoxin
MILKLLREGLGRFVVLIDALTRPEQIQRSEAAQREVDAAAGKLALYQFHACPFCTKTRRAIYRLNLPIELRDAQNDAAHREALAAGGGKIQVPCLRIQEEGGERWLYDSGAIIAFLEGRFGSDPDVEDALRQTP